MEYTQERIATLHDLTGSRPPVDDREFERTAVIVPMTDREYASLAAERVLTELESVAPAAVFVPLRSSPDHVQPFREWLDSFDLPLRPLWCTAPDVEELLVSAGLTSRLGKGRDVWLTLGPAAAAGEYVVVHDADAASYEADLVRKLLAPLTMDYDFSKGYYARVERGQLYGRLCRLFVEPVIRALEDEHDEPIVRYLAAFRYALAGEFAATAELARKLRLPASWGLELGTLGDAFVHAGFDGTAQVDLGRHEHDHRAVAGDTGLEGMSHEVARALFGVLERHGVSPDYETLPDRYRAVGRRLIDQYDADARFNDLAYDQAAECDQVERYANAIVPPDADDRLPAWNDLELPPEDVVTAATPWRGR